MFKNIFLCFILVSFFIACSSAQQKPEDNVKNSLVKFLNSVPSDDEESLYAAGVGTADKDTINETQRLGLSREAAIADAYRKLTEKIKAVKVRGGITVEQKIAKNDLTQTQVEGVIKNAIIEKEQFMDDGGCAVILKLNRKNIDSTLGSEEKKE